MYTTNFDIIGLTETWLNENVSNCELFSSDYNVVRKDRNFLATDKSRGGGVLLAFKSDIAFEKINLDNTLFSSLTQMDIICVKVYNDSYFFYIFLLYVPPAQPVKFYQMFFEAFGSLDFIVGADIVIVGDFNLPDFVQNNLPEYCDNPNFPP